MIVLDASATIELLLNTSNGALVMERIADPAESLHAPHLLSVEVAQVLRRYERGGGITAATATAALDDLRDLGVVRYEHEPFLARVWELRSNVTAYDAVYVALAEALECPLLTFDAALASAPDNEAAVELLS